MFPVFPIPFVEVTPVTPRVPPIVALVVTSALLRVASPVVERVPVPIFPVFVIPAVVVAPVTPKVPCTFVANVAADKSTVPSAFKSPVVVISSPSIEGLKIPSALLRFQCPKTPSLGGVVVKPLVPFV